MISQNTVIAALFVICAFVAGFVIGQTNMITIFQRTGLRLLADRELLAIKDDVARRDLTLPDFQRDTKRLHAIADRFSQEKKSRDQFDLTTLRTACLSKAIASFDDTMIAWGKLNDCGSSEACAAGARPEWQRSLSDSKTVLDDCLALFKRKTG